jgi:uncharacterized RDD family membrane protein YckC
LAEHQAMECPHCHRQTSRYAENCLLCGGHIPESQYLLEESGTIEPPATATSKVSHQVWRLEEDGSGCRTASLGDRLIAFALDSVFLFGVFIVLDAWAFMRWGIVDGAVLKLTVTALLVAESLNATLFFLYFWLLESAFGSTLGKVIVGIRVVQTIQRRPLKAFAIRNLFRIVDGFGFYLVGVLVAGCSRIHRRLGDICAGTVVIESRFAYGVKIAAVILWAAVLAGAVWFVPKACKSNAARHSRYLNQVIVEVGRSGKSPFFRVAGIHLQIELGSGPIR